MKKTVKRVMLKKSPRASKKNPQLVQPAALTIGAAGTLKREPLLIRAKTGDVVAWFVTNKSRGKLNVKMTEFTRVSTGRAASPIRFLDSASVSIGAGALGLVVGIVTFKPAKRTKSEHFKYTISVRGGANVDYDPDLEIIRPDFI
jgi:hypothetical protein